MNAGTPIRPRPSNLGATAALGAMLLAAPALAQNANPSQTAASDERATQIEEITVTAQKRSQNIQDIPITVNAIDGAALKELGIKSSDEISEYISNLQIGLPSGNGNQPIITIRGVGLNDFNTNNAGPNGVYVDEVYMSSPASQTFQTFDLDRVEVLKGPQGTLYGRNTTGGAVNYIAAKPTSTPFASLHASYGSFDTYEADGVISGPITEGLDGRLAFVRNGSDGFMHNLQDGRRTNGANDLAYRGLLEAKPRDDLTLLFNLHGGWVHTLPTEYHQVGTLDATGAQCPNAEILAGNCADLFGYQGPKNLYQGNYNRDQDLDINTYGASLRVDYVLSSATLTSLSAFESSRKFHPEDSDAEPLQLLEIDYGVKSQTYTQEFRVAGGGEKYHWLGGVYYLHEDLKQDQTSYALLGLDTIFGPGAGNGTALIGTDHSNQHTDAYAMFGQADYEVLEGTRLTLGGRYTYEDKTFDTIGLLSVETNAAFPPGTPLYDASERLHNGAASWRAALDHRVAEQVLTYASVSTGFKSGGFNGGFLDINPANALRQLQPIRPEKVTAYEVGFKSDLFDKRLRLNGAAFYYDYRDMQVYNLVPAATPGGLPVSVLDNAPKTSIKGIEFEAEAKPFRDLSTRLNIGLLDAKMEHFISGIGTPNVEDFTGHRLPLSPKFTAEAIVEYAIHMPNGALLKAQTSGSYRSQQFFDVRNDPLLTQDGYWLLNARLAYVADGGRWELAAFGRNLTGTEYLNYAVNLSSPFGLLEEVVGAPRSGGVEATIRF
jgi:iron complex outermembrane receptor protein